MDSLPCDSSQSQHRARRVSSTILRYIRDAKEKSEKACFEIGGKLVSRWGAALLPLWTQGLGTSGLGLVSLTRGAYLRWPHTPAGVVGAKTHGQPKPVTVSR